MTTHPNHPGFRGSWLCPQPHDRRRFVDMHQRLQRTHLVLVGCMALLLAPGVLHSYPPAGVLIVVPGIAAVMLLQHVSMRSERPELPFFASLVLSQAVFVAGPLAARRVDEPDMMIMVWSIAVAYARLPMRAGTWLAAGSGAAIVAAKLSATPDTVAAQPLTLLMPLAAVVALSVFSAAVRTVEVAARREAVLDRLTGLLNRTALHTRATELEQRSRVARAPISVLAADVDHFKRVNDDHGHATGDAVLREVAGRLRAAVDRRGSVYRIGGEEFAVLLPDCRADEAVALADELRGRVAAQPAAGVPVTMSFGVACGGIDGRFAWRDTLREADTALYTAKRDGRNRVRTAADESATADVTPRRR